MARARIRSGIPTPVTAVTCAPFSIPEGARRDPGRDPRRRRPRLRRPVRRPAHGGPALRPRRDPPRLLRPGRRAGARRRAGGQHLGGRPRHLDAQAPTARSCASTCPPSSPAASGWPSPDSRGARHRALPGRPRSPPRAGGRGAGGAAGALPRRDRFRAPLAGAPRPAHRPAGLPRGPRPDHPLRPRRRAWPVEAYQSVFLRVPGSAEMPSAARPFTDALVTDLVTRGIVIAPSPCTPACRRRKPGEPPPMPSVTRATRHRRAGQRRPPRRSAGHRRGDHRGAGAGDDGRRGWPVPPRRGWTELVVTPGGACGWWTAC